MIDATEIERTARHRCLKSFGEVADAIGFDKPLGAYSKDEALRVIDAIVHGYTTAMVEAHEATKYPAIRGLPTTATDPFADLQNDLPWETKP